MITPNREWTHEESPEGLPSASTARLGCKCSECRAAWREYISAYRRSRQKEAGLHSHRGQPSKRTARRWRCTHPRCLDLAGLTVTADGTVVNLSTGRPDPFFAKAAAA